jgi:hypothetical protein
MLHGSRYNKEEIYIHKGILTGKRLQGYGNAQKKCSILGIAALKWAPRKWMC